MHQLPFVAMATLFDLPYKAPSSRGPPLVTPVALPSTLTGLLPSASASTPPPQKKHVSHLTFVPTRASLEPRPHPAPPLFYLSVVFPTVRPPPKKKTTHTHTLHTGLLQHLLNYSRGVSGHHEDAPIPPHFSAPTLSLAAALACRSNNLLCVFLPPPPPEPNGLARL